MAKEADLFAEARGSVHTCTNKGHRDNRGTAQNYSQPDVNKAGGKQENKCTDSTAPKRGSVFI